MAKPPYCIARQEHLGDMLNVLQQRGRLLWRWEHDKEKRRAIFHVALDGQPERSYGTKTAESIALSACDTLAIRWKPVPHPGGETQRAITKAWIDDPEAR